MAVAWKQTAAEYEALYYQGFNLATMRVEQALRARGNAARKPLAVIADLDDTLLDTRPYWRDMLRDGLDFFDDARWDAWVATNRAAASPGAIDFLSFCQRNRVEVFVITSRDQGEKTADLALANIQAAKLPHIDREHLTVLTASSDKEKRQREIAETHDVIALLGDNLNDFRRHYYVADVADRKQRMAEDQREFGAKFIIFPNPTDGHWVRAIFGDSEPPPTPENRARLQRAAEGTGMSNTLTEVEKAAGWRLLFDGTTSTGWHVYGAGPVTGWEIVDGTLVALGQGGGHDIVTDDEFENFELALDWNVSPRANSGIFFNVVEQGHDAIYATGPEYQLIDDEGWPSPLEDWQRTGANYAMHPPLVRAARPVGEWNHTRIVVNRGQVEHWLNGAKTAAYELWTPEWEALRAAGKWKDFPAYGRAKKGRLGLQDHGNKVWFRNIKVRVIRSPE